MATAATRTAIIELVVLANNQAPGTTLLGELITLSDSGQSLTQIAATLTASASFKSTYPSFATPSEFATEFLGNAIPGASAAIQLAGATLIESLMNSGSTRADIIVLATEFLATPEAAADPGFGPAAATFQNKADVAEFYTVNLELDTGLDTALTGVTEDPTTVTASNETNTAASPAGILAAAVTAATTASSGALETNTAAAAGVATAITAAGALATAMTDAVAASDTAAALAATTVTAENTADAATKLAAVATLNTTAAASLTASTTAINAAVTASTAAAAAFAAAAAATADSTTDDAASATAVLAAVTLSENGTAAITALTTANTTGTTAITTAAAIVTAAEEAAAAALLVTASSDAAAAATAATALAVEADTTLNQADLASIAAASAAAATDAAALTILSDQAAAQATTDAGLATAAGVAFDAALAATPPVVANVNNTNGLKLIADNVASLSAAASTAAAAATAAATALDTAASDAVAALASATTASSDATTAANASAVLATAAAAATPGTDDDAAAVLETAAAAATPIASTAIANTAAIAEDARIAAAAELVLTNESIRTSALASTAVGDGLIANNAATAALAVITDNATSAAALVLANTAVTAATAATDAVATFTAAAAATAATADEGVASGLASTAASQASAAGTSVISATAEVAINRTSQTAALTTTIDNLTAGLGDDNFNSIVAAAGSTLTTGDTLDGNTGNDKLTITASLTAALPISGFTTTSVETVQLNVIDGAAGAGHTATTNMLGSAPASLIVTGSTTSGTPDIVLFNNVASTTALTLSNTVNITATVNYRAAFLVGTGDTATLNVDGVVRTAVANNVITFAAGLESLTVNSTGTASAIGALTGAGTLLNVTGNANLIIGDATNALPAAVATINAAGFTGNLVVDVGNVQNNPAVGAAAADLIITGGSGNDTINAALQTTGGVERNINGGDGNDVITLGRQTVGATVVSLGDVLDGGDGTDTLANTSAFLAASTAAVSRGTINFETIATTTALAGTITVANVQATGISTAVILGGTGTLVVPAGSFAVNATAALTNSLTLNDTGTAITDSLTLSNTRATALDVFAGQNIVVGGIETLNISSTGAGAATTQTFGTITMTSDGTTASPGTDTVNFSGGNIVTVGAITAETINASGLTTASTVTTFSMGAAAVGVTTITGSAGRDTLLGDVASTINGGGGNDIITGGTGNDTLNGDGGNDTITSGTGNDAVTGGAGNDTLTFAANLSALDTVNGGDGTDVLSVTNASITALQGLTRSAGNTFNTNFTSVESMSVTDAFNPTGTTFDLGTLNSITTVNLTTIGGGTRTLTGMTSGNTVGLSAITGNDLTVVVNGALAGTAEVLNLNLTRSGADTDYNALTVADIETININVTEATASATSRTATLGINSTKGTALSGASRTASSVIITGSEDIVLDTQVFVDTIDASGLSVRTGTTPGLVMNTALSAVGAAQTITGSSGADIILGSNGADILTGGAGNDSITGGEGSDIIGGGTGTDTLVPVASATALQGTGTGTTNGAAINLGTTAVTAASINSSLGGTIGLSAASTSLAAGTAQHIFATQSAFFSTETDTVTGVENITGTAGQDYIVGSAGANVITGVAGNNFINLGAGNDSINVLTAANLDTNDTIVGGTGTDTVNITNAAATATLDDPTGITNVTVVDTAGANNMSIVLTFTADNTAAITIDASVLDAGEDITISTTDAQADGAYTILGGAGADTIITGDGAANVTGGAGVDAITLDGGTNTVNIAFGGAGIDTITAFIGGTDILNFTGTSDVNDVAGSDIDLDGFVEYDANASVVLAEGLTMFGSDNVNTAVDAGATLTPAEIATFFGDIGAAGGNQTVTVATAGDIAYVVVQGAAGAATLARVTGGGNTVIDTADVVIIGHFAALDTDTLTAANFADFIV